MRVIGSSLRPTIATTGALAIVLLVCPLARGQDRQPQQPSGTGVEAPDNEGLIERSKTSSVQADAIWIEITTVGKNASRWVLDLNRLGSCYVLRDDDGARSIYGGSGMDMKLVKRAFETLTRRSVIYGARTRPTSPTDRRQLVGIGMATWDGSRVYKTQSGALETYPEEVQKIVADLRKATDHLAISTQARGSIQATFLRPAESRRILQGGGKRLVNVKDPGRDAKELSTLEMALRLPGRDIVVPTEEDWAALETYVRASNPENLDSGEFYVKSSARTYRVQMDSATAPAGGINIEEELIPKAKPVQR